MELKDFNELCIRDFDNGAVLDAIRGVFKERDELRRLISKSNGLNNLCDLFSYEWTIKGNCSCVGARPCH